MSGREKRITRSATSIQEDEERARFLEQGATAAQARARGKSADRLTGPAASGTQEARTARAAKRTQPKAKQQKVIPDPVQRADTPGIDDTLINEPQGGTAPARLLNMGIPQSPSIDTTLLWRKDLEKRLLRPPTNIPLEAPQGRIIIAPPAGEGRIGGAEKEVTFANASTPRPPGSVRSTESRLSATRQQELELEEREELAELRRKELRQRAEKRKLDIDAERQQEEINLERESIRMRAALKRTREESECSERDALSQAGSIERWIDESRERKREGVPERETVPTRGPPYEQGRVKTPTLAYGRRERSPRGEPQTPHTRFTNDTSPEVMVQLFERMQMAARPAPKEVYELPPFYGDISEWRSFINTYEESNRRYKFSDYENVARLRAAVKGDAKACVQHILATATRPDLVMTILKKQYGRSDFLIDKALEDLKRIPAVGDSAHDLNQFAIRVVNIVSTLMDLNQRYYADNPMIIREITERLSPHLRSRWCEHARRHERNERAELQKITDFLMEESDLQMSFTHARAPAMRSRAESRPGPGDNPRAGQPRAPVPWRDRSRGPPRLQKWGGPQPRPQEGNAQRKYGDRPMYPQYSRVTYTVDRENAQSAPCFCCGGKHRTAQCGKLSSLHIGARWDWARDNRICYKCLESKHPSTMCKASRKCDAPGCPYYHHQLLHSDYEPRAEYARTSPAAATTAATTHEAEPEKAPKREEPPRWNEPPPASNHAEESSYASASSTERVLLKVIPVILSGPKGEIGVYALLDEASTVSMLEEEIADLIGATGPEEMLKVKGIGAICHLANSRTIKVSVQAQEGGSRHPLTLRTVPALKIKGQQVSKQLVEKYDHLKDAHSACFEMGVPQLLIGADHWSLMIPEEIRVGPKKAPAAVRCALGWAIYGTVPRNTGTNEHATYHVQSEADAELHEMVKRHFAVDALGISLKDNVKPREERAIKIFATTVKRVHKQFEVGQLWREDAPQLPTSYRMAYTRLRNLENKMDRNKEFADEYCKQIENLLSKGYAQRLTEVPESPVNYFLPHFATYNKNKGKYRQVFDAAAKNGPFCLNDFVLEGPDLLQSLIGILFRFREGRFAVCADIQEMFLQIKMRNEDVPSQMFLWRGRQREDKPDIYSINRVCFGVASSPCLAHMTRNHNATMNAKKYPAAEKEIHTNHYMDDFVSSFQQEEEMERTARQVNASHAEGGFKLRGWATNSAALLKHIPEEDRAMEPTSLGDKEQKVLGLTWDPASDTLGFNTRLLRVPEEVKLCKRAPSKREMLSTIMSIYDPMGLIAQYVVTAKVIMQSIWKTVDWDKPLPAEATKQFHQWLEALKHVDSIRIPRMHPILDADATIELHMFVDASEQAYAAVGYWRFKHNGHATVSLAAAKSRVTPLRAVSIPRMELNAAVIGTRLAQTLQREHRYKISKITYWTDSRTVLSWIRDDASRYSPFVSHRLSEIAEHTEPQAWRWVETKLNPADDATRAKPEQKISINCRWYQGPPFLKTDEESWPPVLAEINIEPSELRKIHTTCVTVKCEPSAVLPSVERFSNYERLIRATAYVLLFIEKLKRKQKTLELELRHIQTAEAMWLQNSQRNSFPEELRALSRKEDISRHSKLYSLAPELDSDGIMKIKTRLNQAPVRYIADKPVILSGKDPFTKLLILDAHKRGAHVNNEAIVNSLRQKYWILHLRPTVRAIAQACGLCRLRRAKPHAQPFGDLPAERLEAFQRGFTYAAQDYFGPCWVTVGRRREKRWVALYTCLTTRAVHLEVVHSLSTDSAINALRRFAARRGWPRIMWSDNQTSFRAAALELKAAHNEWLPALRDYGLRQRMEWKFIPPGNPSAGGAWERMVKTVKNALAYTLHERAPTQEAFDTLLAEMENIINSRPLTHVPVDPNDEHALTPNHFLLLCAPDQPLIGLCDMDDRRRWRQVQALANHFWQRWCKEYFPLLAPKKSSDDGGRQIKIGDCVIIADPANPRNVWPKGLVIATNPGPDGRVRSADVKTKHGVFRRPTSRLVVMATSSAQQKV